MPHENEPAAKPLMAYKPGPESTNDDAFSAFLEWSAAKGLSLYTAQEEAIMELFAEDRKHVILNTPTGSGKSLVALALQFLTLCQNKRCYYTAPIKALVSEKFFQLCDELGADNVGMVTGDASINPGAPIVCATAEILSNLALRHERTESGGTDSNGVGATRAGFEIDAVVMDEFHYYADRDRGVAWQLPLLTMPHTQFLLMSATLGDMRRIILDIEQRTGREVAWVKSTERPVPLDFSYRLTPLHETLEDLVAQGQAPVYLVNFTQRETAEQAQALVSAKLCTKEEKALLSEAIGDFRFDTPYGKDVRRFVRAGIGIHHAGLLPKYRLLMERLAQQGLLKVISGTDTLGVGVNVPIRTVLFTKLYKYDGQKTAILSARDFKQISGRAGRKGFDVKGTVVCQAPPHVIENRQLEAKSSNKQQGKRKFVRKKPPRGYVPYDEKTFYKLVDSDPEPLRSSFAITHGMLTQVLDREATAHRRDGGYARLIGIIAESHESERKQRQHKQRAASLFRSLRGAGIVEVNRPPWSSQPHVRLNEGLQQTFSLNQPLSLFLVETLFVLDQQLDSYPLDVLSLVESIQENPRVLLLRQLDKAKGDLIAELKSQGVDYEERMKKLDEVSWPKPNAEFIYEQFGLFRDKHPWVESNVGPKGIAREMLESWASFNEYVRQYALQRSEGVLYRYLGETYKIMVQTLPPDYRTEGVEELISFLRVALEHADTSLVAEWERLMGVDENERTARAVDIDSIVKEKLAADPAAALRRLSKDKKAFYRRIRAELYTLLRAMCLGEYAEVAMMAGGEWTEETLRQEMQTLRTEHGDIIYDHRARMSDLYTITTDGPGKWIASVSLLNAEGEIVGALDAEVALNNPDQLLRLRT